MHKKNTEQVEVRAFIAEAAPEKMAPEIPDFFFIKVLTM